MSSPPVASSADKDSHPPIPVSHPRTSSRSPSQTHSSPQPPISPPRSSTNKSSSNNATPTPAQTVPAPVAFAPPKPPLTPPAPSARQMESQQQQHSYQYQQHAIPSGATVAASMMQEDSLRTPNVYINGLPPNFSEEQLYAMTKDFGGVISVRTFTRHVSDRPSGYGFVLFDNVDSAEKCIESLRRYRNLHPSFSKQIHKIPGTPYASLTASSSSSSVSTSSSNESAETFKARMERLKDQSSTNLYIEGLPLSIDETTLAALVNPFIIKSSRFFQTRLSHPPRIIAFVRLESRSACEDVIERLHGRMVRGWNDAGSRISVRFADSAEQRELRRNERNTQEGEQSPARLTMAQAALLNLRGQQIQNRFRNGQQSASAPSITEMQRQIPPIGDRYPSPVRGRATHTGLPVHPLTAQYHQQTDAGVGFPASRSAPARLPARGPSALPVADPVFGNDIDLSLLSRTASANGFTPLEQQLILQAQAQAQVQAQLRAEVEARQEALYESQMNGALSRGGKGPRSTGRMNLSMAMASKEFVPRGLLSRIQEAQSTDGYSLPSLSPVDVLSPRSEEEFHATAQLQQQPFEQQRHTPATMSLGFNTDTRIDTSIYDNGKTHDPSNHLSSSLDYTFSNIQTEGGRMQSNQALHTRSTTLPPHFMLGGSSVNSTNTLSSILSPNLNSMSNTRNSVNTTAEALASRLNAALPTICTIPKSGSGSTIHSISSDTVSSSNSNMSSISSSSNSSSISTCTTSTSISAHSTADSPLLVPSPALTYNSSASSSSSRTPSTLSPTTPFFGSFAHAGDGFGNAGNDTYGKGSVGEAGQDHAHQDVAPTEAFVGKMRVGSQ